MSGMFSWSMIEGTLLLPKRVLRMLEDQRAKHLPEETGGFLLGMRRGSHIEVTDATLQGPADRATRRSFERLDPDHARRAVAAWEAHEGTVGLVGDWHTHPFGDAVPSPTDKKAWRTLVVNLRAEAVGLILAEPALPGIFLARRPWPIPRYWACSLIEETSDELIFAKRFVRPA